ncbi:DNA repair protein RecO [Longimicrobium sp.]|uniref:DNA repair protein RecO n=1 Tax=Longimicrobium sp. TaxID=2029185 RepID=UPI002D1A1D42|nr:DNA repair protein RecO [Longimicrobium sp.]HSU14992.1 DNA repair protein RecO [Longimicrobium sp.]
MALVSTRALVLQAFPYSETSKILRLYTWDHGLVSVIAKGALRPKSRYGGVLEPFTEGTATFYHRYGRDLHTLGGFDLLRSRQALGRSLVGFAGASLLSEVVMRTGTEEPHPDLYHALADAWDLVAEARGPEQALAASLTGAWSLIVLLGFEPQAGACIHCGRVLDPDEPVRFDAMAGGAACTGCRRAGRVLDAESRAELRRMLAGHVPEGGVARPGTHRALLKAFLEAQLAQDRPFRSLELFLESAGTVPGAPAEVVDEAEEDGESPQTNVAPDLA